MEIKVANKNDLELLEPVLIEVEHQHVDLEPGIFKKIYAYDREHFNTLIENEHEIIYYAEIDGEVAGVLVAVEREFPPITMFIGRVFVVVEELSVTKKFRRQGVAKALMEKVEDWARTRGCTQMQLSVWAKNTGAIELYEGLDYERKLIRYYKTLD